MENLENADIGMEVIYNNEFEHTLDTGFDESEDDTESNETENRDITTHYDENNPGMDNPENVDIGVEVINLKHSNPKQ